MKIRSSFVTNSSSSSFVVSAKREKKKEMSDFFVIVNCMEGYETGTPVLVSSEKDLNNYVEREYSRTLPDLMESDEYYKERYGNILKELRDGNIILMQDISYGDEELFEKILHYVVGDYTILNRY